MNLEDIKSILELGKENIKNDPRKYKYFEKVYNENCKDYPICSSCGDGYSTAYNYLETVYLQQIKNPKKMAQDQNQKFLLNKGGTIHTPISPSGVLADNATDEQIIWLLQSNENYINACEKFPENWKEIIADHPTFHAEAGIDVPAKTDENDLTLKTKKELQEIASNGGYPESEWSTLNKEKLLAYLTEVK